MPPSLRTVLVATDFSHGAEHALARAMMLPLAPGARVIVLHVAPGDLPTEVRARAEQHARDQLARAVAAVGVPAGVDVVPEVATGEPFAQLIAHARLVEADLIVVGRHGRSGVKDLVIGTTAERAIRYGDIPVLVVHRPPEGPYHRPVVAADLSETSRRVADLALRVVPAGTELDVVHAYRMPFEDLQFLVEPVQQERELAAHAKAAMQAFLDDLDEPARWHPVIARGDARSVLLSELTARDADLVVLGTHARSGLAHLFVGSVAEWLSAVAPCDVLVGRPSRFTFATPWAEPGHHAPPPAPQT